MSKCGAEISPHFRPELWEPLGRLVKTTANATAAKKIAALDLRRPMRFTGHLFYDGSHKPCTETTLDQLDRARGCGRHADVGVMGILKKNRAPVVDEGLQQIDEFERLIVLGRVQLLEFNQIPAEEVERERIAVVALAKAVTDRMRSEYLARSSQR